MPHALTRLSRLWARRKTVASTAAAEEPPSNR